MSEEQKNYLKNNYGLLPTYYVAKWMQTITETTS